MSERDKLMKTIRIIFICSFIFSVCFVIFGLVMYALSMLGVLQ